MARDYKKRETVEFKRNGTLHRVTAAYGWTCIDGQAPYFSITYTEREHNGKRWHESSCGTNHEVIAEHFPQLTHLTKWHGVSRDASKGPMHYLANAKYWARIAAGEISNTEYGPEPMGALKSTIVFGALPSDHKHAETLVRDVIYTDWLATRLPMLMQAFRLDMERAELWAIGEETHNAEGGR